MNEKQKELFESDDLWKSIISMVIPTLLAILVMLVYNMADMMHIPVLGLVENYSYIQCPDCGKKIEIFGESHIDEVAAELSVPVIGKMPMDRKFATAADAGRIYDVENSYLASAKELLEKL